MNIYLAQTACIWGRVLETGVVRWPHLFKWDRSHTL